MRQLLSQAGLHGASENVLIFLLIVFCLGLFWIFRRGGKKRYEILAQLPLMQAERVSGENGRKKELL